MSQPHTTQAVTRFGNATRVTMSYIRLPEDPNMSTLTIRIDEKLETDLKRLAKQQKRSKSELVRDILRRYTAAELFEESRRRLQPYAQRAGYLTDEDFFRDFS